MQGKLQRFRSVVEEGVKYKVIKIVLENSYQDRKFVFRTKTTKELNCGSNGVKDHF